MSRKQSDPVFPGHGYIGRARYLSGLIQDEGLIRDRMSGVLKSCNRKPESDENVFTGSVLRFR